ncbi:MAG TPA: peptidylprolyl isomerase [Verrucomicrobiae bacterium]|jgi:cyclophilin family peptidyl-prolyl cis-trans isomerase
MNAVQFFPLLLSGCLAVTTGFAGSVVQFNVPGYGQFQLELFDREKPVAVGNFLHAITNGLYSNHFFHRCDPAGALHGGSYWVTNRFVGSPALSAIVGAPALTNDPPGSPVTSNFFGTLSAVCTNAVGGQWPFEWCLNLGDGPAPGSGAVFGRLLSGASVLQQFRLFSVTNTTTNLLRSSPPTIPVDDLPVSFDKLPFRRTNTVFSNLVFADIQLLGAGVRLDVQPGTNGQRVIRWNSFSNRPNVLEFTSALPATNWQPALTTIGMGTEIQFVDTNTAAMRHYRVRVDF